MSHLLLRNYRGAFFVSLNVLLGFCSSLLLATYAYAQPLVAEAGNFYTHKILLATTINHQDTHQVVLFLQTTNGKLLVNQHDLENWHVVVPQNIPTTPYEHQMYYCLDDLFGVHYVIDTKNMAVTIMIPGQLFSEHTLSGSIDNETMPTKPPLGAFLNYNLLAQREDGNSAYSSSQLGGMFTASIFNKYGNGASDFVLRHDYTKNFDGYNYSNQAVRLNTAWTIDNPGTMHSWRVGDSFSNPGMWGKSVDFGGIHWGTNFSTQPHFITYPLPNATGVATLPSAVDLYVNNTMFSRRNVESGPFTINTVPVINGAGNLNVVTTDLLGRQQTVSIPYYVSNTLLRPGIRDLSYDVGFVRENFGNKSDDYGKFATAANYRTGLTNNLTTEWRAEFMPQQETVGMGGNYLLSRLGVFNAAVAVSNSSSQGSQGEYLALGFQRQALSGISYGINTQSTSKKFTQIGLQDGQLSASFIGQLFVGVPLPNQASLGLSYIQQNNRDFDNANLVGVSYNQEVFKKWSLGVSATANVVGVSNKSCFINLTRGFGDNNTFSLNGDLQAGSNQGTAHLTRSLPVGPGWGYDIYTAQGQQSNYQASVSAQGDKGTYTGSVAEQNGSRGYKVETSGAVAAMGGQPYLSRNLGDSFAIVQVPDYSKVRVYSSNQLVATTDKHGNALVPRLLPYDNNPIRIEPNDLPLDAKVDATEMNAVPYYKSGLLLHFPVEPYYGALIKLQKVSGELIPAGAVVTPVKDNKHNLSFYVGENGEAYLTGLHQGVNEMQTNWDDSYCQFVVYYRKTDEMLPDLGTIICKPKT